MAPRKSNPPREVKREKKVMDIAQKMKILDLLDDGKTVAEVARKFNVNESTIRSIRTKKNEIRNSSSHLGQHAKFVKYVRGNHVEKMEEMLMIWLQDMNHRSVPISTAVLRSEALRIHAHLNQKYQKTESFNASKGWFERFKTRYDLHNLKFSGESASADHEAAQNFLPDLQETITEKGYFPDQVFNCDETGLFWKRMPDRTWISKDEKRAPGFKVAKDRFTLLLCGNASGNLKCKPMLVYRSENPRALKGKNKDHLPVHWKSNKTAWVTKANFSEWLKESFIPEVKEFLLARNLAFKVLLLMDNCKSHCVGDVHPNIEIMFLPANTTSLIQPMDQTVIATFKSYYLQRVMDKMVQFINYHRQCEDFHAMNVVKTFWKKFSIADSITFIQESWQQIEKKTMNRCWRKLWPEVVPPKTTPETPEYQTTVQNIVHLAQQVGGEGFQDLQEPEIVQLLLPSNTGFTVEELEDLAEPLPSEVEINQVPKVEFDGKTILKIINSLQSAVELALEKDPIMIRSLEFKHNCEKAVEIYEELYKDALRRAKQSKLTDFFQSQQ